jgi:hypothetical protein
LLCVAAAACSGQSSSTTRQPRSPVEPAGTVVATEHSTTPPHAPSDRHPPLVATGTRVGSAVEREVSAHLRAVLLRNGARTKGFPVRDYRFAQIDFFATDRRTHDLWAGGGLDANQRSLHAQVSEDDNGSYEIWHRTPTTSWQMQDVGEIGAHSCPVPSSIGRLWKFRRDDCTSRLF